MTSAEVELSLAKRFHALAGEYDRRPALARRSILNTLIRFLKRSDPQLLQLSLETVHLLGQHPENRNLFAELPALEACLLEVQQNTALEHPEMHLLATAILDRHRALAKPFTPRPCSPSPTPITSSSSKDRSDSPLPTPTSSQLLFPPAPPSLASTGALTGARPPPMYTALQAQELEYPRPRGRENLEEEERLVEPSQPEAYSVPVEPPISDSVPPTDISLRALTLSPSVHHLEGSVSGPGVNNPHMITFDVPHLYPRTNTVVLEHVLQTLQGVVSYHLYPSQHQIRVYMICKPQIVQQAMEQQAQLRSTVIQDEVVLFQDSQHLSTRGGGYSFSLRNVVNDLCGWWPRSAASSNAERSPEAIKGCYHSSSYPPSSRAPKTAASQFLDPTETRAPTWWNLARLFFYQFFYTFEVFTSPAQSNLEARVHWQRKLVMLEQRLGNADGVGNRFGERVGKFAAHLWLG